MKLHDLRPPKGSNTPRTRVGRGIAANKGKTAGRGTKGQKARTGSSIPGWFEGGQTPIHIRIPKLRGFRNRSRVEYEVVNLARISQLVELGELEAGSMPDAKGSTKAASKAAPITVNQEILRAAGLVSTLKKPLKILGHGEVSVPLFVVADRFSKSAVTKIEAAGGSVQALEIPKSPMAAIFGKPAAPAAPQAEDEAAPRGGRKASAAEAPQARSAKAPGAPARHERAPADEDEDAAPRERPSKAHASEASAPAEGAAKAARGGGSARPSGITPKAEKATAATGGSGAKSKRSPDAAAHAGGAGRSGGAKAEATDGADATDGTGEADRALATDKTAATDETDAPASTPEAPRRSRRPTTDDSGPGSDGAG
jgi:large subunit ribosomal protein L15